MEVRREELRKQNEQRRVEMHSCAFCPERYFRRCDKQFTLNGRLVISGCGKKYCKAHWARIPMECCGRNRVMKCCHECGDGVYQIYSKACRRLNILTVLFYLISLGLVAPAFIFTTNIWLSVSLWALIGIFFAMGSRFAFRKEMMKLHYLEPRTIAN